MNRNFIFPGVVLGLVFLFSWGSAQTVVSGRSPLVDDGGPDGWSGLFVMAPVIDGPGGIEQGTVKTFNFWADAARADGLHHVTPILVRRSGGVYRVHGIGTTRSPDSPGVHTEPFGLTGGSDRVDLGDGASYHIAVLQQWDGGDDNGGSLIPFGGSGGAGMFVQNTVGPGHVPAVDDVIGSNYSSGVGGRNYSFNFEIEFVANPEPPTDISLAVGDLFPGLPVGSEIGVLASVDPNPGDTHTYTLVSNAGGVFGLEADRLRLSAEVGPVGTNYLVRVRSTDADGLSVEKEFSLTVDAAVPPEGLILSAASVNATSPVGALVGTMETVDGNAGDRHAYALVAGAGDADNALFAIEHGNELRLRSPIPAGQPVLRARVRTTDLSGASHEERLEIAVIDSSFRINEFMAGNVSHRQDADGDFPDWIEIYNEQGEDAELGGWYLTDDPGDLTKWPFPDLEVGANGFLVLFASGKDRANPGGELHTNFELASDGDYLALVKPDGVTIADQVSFGRQFPDLAFGRSGNGETEGYLEATPAAPNGTAYEFGANEVIFSRERGFHDSSFSLELAATVPGSVIRFTLDGTRPSAQSGSIYSAPVTVRPGTGGSTRGTRIVRAIAIHESAAVQPVATHTFLFVNGVSRPDRDGIVGQSVFRSSITGHATYGPLMDDALLAQPAISIVGGIPGSTEAARSVEFFTPDGSETGFQIDCGMKVVGGHSVSSPKNNFRLYFRGEYGTSKLRYDLFKEHPYSTGAARVFDRLNLRSGSHDSFFWLANPGNPPNSGGPQKGDAQYLRNRWINDMQFVMGHESLHGRWVHVYVNGTYHGHYQLHEWPNHDYLGSYLPGQASDFEYTNGANPAKSGSDNWQATWSALKAAANSSFGSAGRWIDLENLADYQILNFYAGNPWDWNPNQNWMAGGPARSNLSSGGWKFFGWDSDICLQDPGANVLGKNVPDGLFQSLMNHEDFRVLFRDRVYKHCFHGGALTPLRAEQVHRARADQIRLSIIAETARWQGSAASPPWDRDGEWEAELNRMSSYFRVRTRNLMTQLRRHSNWYPLEAPEFDVRGGFVAAGHLPVLTSPAGTIYFTTDGSDPRRRGGGVSPSATEFRPGSLVIDEATVVRARVWDGTTWSALNEAGFAILGTQLAATGNVTLSEIHYHPYDSEDYEFLEFKNTSAVAVDFTGVSIGGGVHFTFPLGSVVPAGGHIVVVENTGAFSARYINAGSPWHEEGIVVAGQWSGNLGNDGESLTVTDAAGDLLLTVDYNDGGSWPGRADGRGSAAELENPSLVPVVLAAKAAYLNEGRNWRSTSEFHGSPGRDGQGPDNRLVFNEVFSNSDPPEVDAFELLNTGEGAIDASGWLVSDDADDFGKYRMAPGSVVEGGGFLTLDETDFNHAGNPNSIVPFALNGSRGDDLYLVEPDGDGNPLRFVDRVEFGAARVGETFGRWPDGGRGELYPMESPTLGQANGADGNSVRVGTVVVAEIHYNPDGPDEGREFVTICNAGGETENLGDWQLRGEVDFDFGPETVLAPGGFLVLVGFDPREEDALGAFRAEYGLDPVVPVFGPWTNGGSVPTKLGDGGGAIRLLRPDVLVVPDDGSPAFFPMLIEDVVNYDDIAPWPLSADGSGDSLLRVSVEVYGDDPGNWSGSSSPLRGISYATWAAEIFPEDTPPADQLEDADYDGDGMSNFAEFAFVLDALNGGGVVPASVVAEGDAILVRYRTRPAAHGLIYAVGVSEDLQVFDFSESLLEFVAANPLPDGSVEVTMRYSEVARESAQLFFQVRVVADE